MRPEVYLDRLLAMRERGERLPSVPMDNIADCLDVEEKLSELQKVSVSSTFTQKLETSLRSHIRMYHHSQQNSTYLSQARPQISRVTQNPPARPRPGKRWRQSMVLGSAAVLVLAFTIFIANFSLSLSGRSHYTAQQPTQHSASEPATHVTDEINRLHAALMTLSQVVNDRNDDQVIQQALALVVTRTQSCHAAVEALPTGPERESAQQKLHIALDEESRTFYSLLKLVDWSIKLRLTQQLGALDKPVPQIKEIAVQEQEDAMMKITLTGMHFASGANFMIDGKPGGSISKINAERLIGLINHAELFSGTHAFGVLNPDGTAAQIAFEVHDDIDDD